MASIREIAQHLGVSHSAVAKTLKKMKITDWQHKSLDEIRLAYLERLRNQAAGYESTITGQSLIDVKIKREQLETRLLELKIARETEQLVDINELLPELLSLVHGFKNKLIGLATVIKTELDAVHGINVDIEWLEEQAEGTLEDFSKTLEKRSKELEQERLEKERATAETC